MWVSEEGRVQGHAYAICVIKDIIHLHRGFFCCQINSRGTHICLLSSCPIFKYFEYPIPNSYLPLASIHFFIYYISAVICMHAKQYMYAIIITSDWSSCLNLFRVVSVLCTKTQYQPPLEKGIFSICEMVIFGQEMSRMSVLFMTSHTGFWISWEQSILNSTCFGCPKTAATCTHPGYPTTKSEWWLPCLLVFIPLHSKPHIRPLVQRGFTESKSTQLNQNSFLAYHTERERKIERSRLCRRQSSRGV